MGFKLAADFDVELFLDGLSKRLADRDEALRAYLTRPHINFRALFGTIPVPSTTRAVIDLGAPAGGLLWSIQQANLSCDDPFTTGTNVTGAFFVGGISRGLEIGAPIDMAQVVAVGLAPPANYQAGGKSILARANQHLYAVLAGSGFGSFKQFHASATVLEVPDTREALSWL